MLEWVGYVGRGDLVGMGDISKTSDKKGTNGTITNRNSQCRGNSSLRNRNRRKGNSITRDERARYGGKYHFVRSTNNSPTYPRVRKNDYPRKKQTTHGARLVLIMIGGEAGTSQMERNGIEGRCPDNRRTERKRDRWR